MGWTAYATKDDNSITLPKEEIPHFRARAAEVSGKVNTVDGMFPEGALGLSLNKIILERAVGYPLDNGNWGPGYVGKALECFEMADMSNLVDGEGEPIEERYVVGARAFLETCVERGLGVRFYP